MFLLCQCYRYQNKDGPTIHHINQSLEWLLQKYPSAGIMLLGDFNSLKTTTLCNSFKLKQIVQNPTRKEAILDKVLTNMADYYGNPVVGPQLGSSDHNIVIASPCAGTSWKHKICSRSSVTYHQMKTEHFVHSELPWKKRTGPNFIMP